MKNEFPAKWSPKCNLIWGVRIWSPFTLKPYGWTKNLWKSTDTWRALSEMISCGQLESWAIMSKHCMFNQETMGRGSFLRVELSFLDFQQTDYSLIGQSGGFGSSGKSCQPFLWANPPSHRSDFCNQVRQISLIQRWNLEGRVSWSETQAFLKKIERSIFHEY